MALLVQLQGHNLQSSQLPSRYYVIDYRRFTTPCNSKKVKRITTTTELMVVWSVSSTCTSTVNQRFLWPQLLIQRFTLLPQMLQGVVNLLYFLQSCATSAILSLFITVVLFTMMKQRIQPLPSQTVFLHRCGSPYSEHKTHLQGQVVSVH